MAEETRRCFRCEEIKPIKQFRFHNKKLGTRHRRCNRCHANRRAVIVKNNPEKIREANLYYSGLTLEAYKALWDLQKGLCWICQKPETGKKRKYLAIDHSHTSDQFRALLCGRCNSALGFFNDDIRILKRAVLYLHKFAD